MDCQKDKNKQNCNCTYSGCPRFGVCCECVQYHKEMNQLPACYFSNSAEASYDRSFQKFVEDIKNRGLI